MTRKVEIGTVRIGGGSSVKIQSMTTFRPSDTENTVKQIKELEAVGCDIVRFCVLDEHDAKSIRAVKDRVKIPLVADIHFNFRLGIQSLEYGADKIRINPGNIGGDRNIELLADAIKAHKAAVRVGSNSGSLEKKHIEKYGIGHQALVESALEKAALLENKGVNDIVLSVKASDAAVAVKAYRLAAKLCDYPLHLGITEAGTFESGIIKSAVGLGALLIDGIGDTVRVSLSGNPVPEIDSARKILRAAGRDKNFVEVIACPTCGRCAWDCSSLAQKVEKMTENISKPLKIAVMGCAVNGPGEAKECDLGIAGGAGVCIIFKKGKAVKTVPLENAEEEFIKEIKDIIK